MERYYTLRYIVCVLKVGHYYNKISFSTVLEYAEHGDLFASWCCTPNRQVPLEITRLYSAEIALALGMYTMYMYGHSGIVCLLSDFLHSRRVIYRDLKVCITVCRYLCGLSIIVCVLIVTHGWCSHYYPDTVFAILVRPYSLSHQTNTG